MRTYAECDAGDLGRNVYSDRKKGKSMKHIMTLGTRDMEKSMEHGGCGECQTSCQSACKTSCGIANQQCENENR